ncbi:hypothetical protein Poly30_55450 [Planctomycetes bacterium Poly30]|uniref:FG-GAP repeat protein n=1 Tax=Saltatorellus ferox TaxID=2528018 RepID=A0A518F0Y6_9BACT|nr:hypothetical protein Poly30_55450 [Planctomycetes bacterium Poly30]
MFSILTALALTLPQQCPTPIAKPPGFPGGFGGRVAIDGGRAVLIDDRTCTSQLCVQGAAFFYRYEPITGQWNYESALHRADQASLDTTGRAVDIDGDTVVVSSVGDVGPNALRTGSVTVWDYDGTNWIEGQTLFPSNGFELGGFGEALDLEGDLLAVGNGATYWDERGSVSVFRRGTDGTWHESAIIEPRTPSTATGFGHEVKIAGHQILVTTINGTGHDFLPVGAVIVFEENAQTGEWLGVQRLTGSTAHALFGRSLSVDGDRLAVASWPRLNAFDGPPTRGAAFVFERDPAAGLWSEFQRLQSGSILAFDDFGKHVALDGARVYVGARLGHELYFFHQPFENAPFQRSPYRSFEGFAIQGGSGKVGEFFVADGGHVLTTGYQSIHEGYKSWFLEGAPLTDCDGDGFDDDCALALGWQLDENGDGHVDTCGELGTRICFGRDNSEQRPTRLTSYGSRRVVDADFHVRAMGMRQLVNGYLLVSDTTGFVPLAGGSMGDLCIAGPRVGRFSQQVQVASPQGTIDMQVNLTALPQPTGPVVVTPGDTWYFQYWHRDQRLGGGQTSTFSDAVGVTFE